MIRPPSKPNWARTSSSPSNAFGMLSPEAQLAVHQAYHESHWEEQEETKAALVEVHEILDTQDTRLAHLETVWKVGGVIFHPVFWRVAGGMFIVAAALSSTPLGKQILAVIPAP